ncbi:MAG: Spy/CpxP family protein refolding chaperone [Candidatus Omnitrophota bacterium]
MKTRFMVVASLVLVLVLGLAMPLSYAYDRGKSKKYKGEGLDGKIYHKAGFLLKNKKKLGLSDGQVKKIKAMKIKTKKDLIKRKAEIELIAVDIKKELWKDTVNAKAVKALIGKKYDLKKQKAQSLLDTYMALKNVLTEEQKETLKGFKCK